MEKVKHNEEHSIFTIAAMAKGHVTTDEHHFYNWLKTQEGSDNLVDMLGGTLAKLERGARIPSSKICQNPMYAMPTVMAQKFFGQSPIPKVAMDQIIAKPIGVFQSAMQGSAGGASMFLSSALFGGGAIDLRTIMGKLIGGSAFQDIMSETHQLFGQFNSMLSMAESVLGATGNTVINLSNITELTSLMQGASAVLAGATSSPFSSTTISDGALFAQDVVSYIKKNS